MTRGMEGFDVDVLAYGECLLVFGDFGYFGAVFAADDRDRVGFELVVIVSMLRIERGKGGLTYYF